MLTWYYACLKWSSSYKFSSSLACKPLDEFMTAGSSNPSCWALGSDCQTAGFW